MLFFRTRPTLSSAGVPRSELTPRQERHLARLDCLAAFQDFIFGAYFLVFYRDIWKGLNETYFCILIQFMLLVQDFNMMLGSTILRSVAVKIEGPYHDPQERHPKDSPIADEDKPSAKSSSDFLVRVSKAELVESCRSLAHRLLIRLITAAAAPLLVSVCYLGPNAAAFPSLSAMPGAVFGRVMFNYLLMFLSELCFVALFVCTLYRFFRVNLIAEVSNSLLQSPLSRYLMIASCIHLLQDFYTATISLPTA